MAVRLSGFGLGRKAETAVALIGSGVLVRSSNERGDERPEQGFAASACVVHELEEAEVKRQLVLRDASMQSQPGTQQRPEPFHGVDVDLAEAVAVLVAGILAAPVADGTVQSLGERRERYDQPC